MVQEFFSNVIDSVRSGFQHLVNADPLILVIMIAAIALFGYFLLRR